MGNSEWVMVDSKFINGLNNVLNWLLAMSNRPLAMDHGLLST